MEDSFGRPFDLIFGDGGGSSLFTDFCVIKTEHALLDLFETSPNRESGTVSHFRIGSSDILMTDSEVIV